MNRIIPIAVQFYMKRTGEVAVIYGQSFYRSGGCSRIKRWSCYKKYCPAAATTNAGQIIKADLIHNHPLLKFVIRGRTQIQS